MAEAVDDKLARILVERQTALTAAQDRVRHLQSDVNTLSVIKAELEQGTLAASLARRLVEFLGGI